MRRAVLLFGLIACSGVFAADYSKDEQEIRSLIKKQDDGTKRNDFATDDIIFVSGALARPVIGKTATPELVVPPNRKNQHQTTDVQRIVIAKSGDMAYEFSNFRLVYDDSRGHSDFPGSQLRVWQKVNGQWRLAADFHRANRPLQNQQ